MGDILGILPIKTFSAFAFPGVPLEDVRYLGDLAN